jgi:hypothetical protein
VQQAAAQIRRSPTIGKLSRRVSMADREDTGSVGEILLYQTEDGHTRIECRFEDDNLWLTQKLIADLFQKDVRTVNEHLQNIYEEGELAAAATIRKFRIVRLEGKREVARMVDHYNLDAILAVGYRVRSAQGTRFRQWATAQLKEYLVKGFLLDDQRLKNPGDGKPDYFDEVLERIRDIRSAEKRMYLKVRDIFSLAADYQPEAAETLQFFQIIQNKLHWAATGKTAAEIIAERADHTKPNMGLTIWQGTKVRKEDVTVAKNYLREPEIQELNRIVTMYLDFAEDQARRRRVLYMKDWREKLDAFLKFNERDILTNAGKVAKEVADKLALDHYQQLHTRRLVEDSVAAEREFEKAVRQLPVMRKAKKKESKK